MDKSRRSSDDPIVRSLTDRVETLQRRVHRLEQVATVLVKQNLDLRQIVEATVDEDPPDSGSLAQPIEDGIDDIERDDVHQPELVLEAVAAIAETDQIDIDGDDVVDDESKPDGGDASGQSI